MSRRSKKSRQKSSSNLVPIIIGVVIALIAVAGIVFIPQLIRGESNSNVKDLDAISYNKNAKSKVGNKYKITGKILAKDVDANSDRIRLTIEPDNAPDEALGMFISQEKLEKLSGFNLELNNKYIFFVEVDKSTFLHIYNIEAE